MVFCSDCRVYYGEERDGARTRPDDGIYSWILQYPVDRRPRVAWVPLNRRRGLDKY